MKRKYKIYYSSTLVILLFILGMWKPLHFGEEETNFYKEGDVVLVAAHRGSHANFPENSINAIKESIRTGIDIIEIDIRQTRDKKLVVLHDKNIDRTTNGTGLITNYYLDDLQNFNLMFEGKPTKERIPTLSEIFAITKDKCIVNLDFKLNDLEALKRAADLISEYQMENSVIISIKDLDLIPGLYAYNSNIRIMPVVKKRRRIKQVLKYDFIDIIQLNHRSYSKKLLRKIEEKNIAIWVNSLKKYDKIKAEGKPGFKRLLKIKKVDVIQTDYPEELLSVLRQKGIHP